MKAIEFQSQLNSEGTLPVPLSVAASIPLGQTVRVLVLMADDADDREWERLAAEEFGYGYAEQDAIYDKLSER